MTQNKLVQILLAGAALCVASSASAQSQTAKQKFYSLEKMRNGVVVRATKEKFVPLKRPNARPLIFVPSGKRPTQKNGSYKNNAPANKPAPTKERKPLARPLPQGQAQQVLSIYESVE